MKIALMIFLMPLFVWAGGSSGGNGGTLAVNAKFYSGLPASYQIKYPRWACWTTFPKAEIALQFCKENGATLWPGINFKSWRCQCDRAQGFESR